MPHIKFLSLRLNMVRLLSLMCLLFITAVVTAAQTPSLRINDIAAVEGDSQLFGYEFEVRLSGPSTNPVSVTLTTQNGTATGDVDYGAGSVTLNFQPGQTSQLVTVFIVGDTVVEGTETFFLNMSNPVNATIADGQGKATIIDDDTFFLVNQDGGARGLAVDSVFHSVESFAITNNMSTFSSDNRMRISVFAVGLKLAAGETASAVTATAEDSVGTIRPLTVEFVGRVPPGNWLTQVVVKLNDQITTAQDIKIRITLHGVTTNAVLVAVKPS